MKNTQQLNINKHNAFVVFIINGRDRLDDCSVMLNNCLHRTLGIIKPDGMPQMGKILDAVWQCGFQITKMRMILLERSEAMEFYKDLCDDRSAK